MARVTSAQFQKRFGTYSEMAQREPVTITNHGRDSLVLVSTTEYAWLKAMATGRSYAIEEAPAEFIEALNTARAPESAKKFDGEE